jgi:hypothetical protein
METPRPDTLQTNKTPDEYEEFMKTMKTAKESKEVADEVNNSKNPKYLLPIMKIINTEIEKERKLGKYSLNIEINLDELKLNSKDVNLILLREQLKNKGYNTSSPRIDEENIFGKIKYILNVSIMWN